VLAGCAKSFHIASSADTCAFCVNYSTVSSVASLQLQNSKIDHRFHGPETALELVSVTWTAGHCCGWSWMKMAAVGQGFQIELSLQTMKPLPEQHRAATASSWESSSINIQHAPNRQGHAT
jgi:hypothetical protein